LIALRWPLRFGQKSHPSPSPGFFGKTPAYPDFVCRHLHHGLVEVWEGWLREGLAAAEERLGDVWHSIYHDAPRWHFALPPGVCGPKAWTGVFAPSVDQGGRKFPFTLAAEWPGEAFPHGLPVAVPWHWQAGESLAKLLLECLNLDAIDAELARLGPPPPATAAQTEKHAWPDSQANYRIPPAMLGCLQDWPYFSLERLATMPSGHSAWWTEGDERVGPALLFCPGLPPAEGFAALFDGQWAMHSWQDFSEPEVITHVNDDDPTWIEGCAAAPMRTGQSGPLCLLSAGETHAGKVRAINEDAYLNRPEQGLWAVADGMGGHEAGEVASQLVIGRLDGCGPADTLDKLLDRLEQRLRQTHDELQAQAQQGQYRSPPGSTVVVLLAAEREGACAWLGDSRAYRWRSGELVPLTRDHSQVEDYVRKGVLSPEQARCHSDKNIISRAIGGKGEFRRPDTMRFDILPGDVFLLCSDGLSNELEEAEINTVLAETGQDPRSACERLRDMVLMGPAQDNFSLVVVVVKQDIVC